MSHFIPKGFILEDIPLTNGKIYNYVNDYSNIAEFYSDDGRFMNCPFNKNNIYILQTDIEIEIFSNGE